MKETVHKARNYNRYFTFKRGLIWKKRCFEKSHHFSNHDKERNFYQNSLSRDRWKYCIV